VKYFLPFVSHFGASSLKYAFAIATSRVKMHISRGTAFQRSCSPSSPLRVSHLPPSTLRKMLWLKASYLA